MKDKDYKIYRFDVYLKMTKSKDEDKCHEQRWENAVHFNQFKENLINIFNEESFADLVKYTKYAKYLNIEPAKYKKSWLFNQYEIGIDMLKENLGLCMEHQWGYIYFKVPLNQHRLIKFFDSYNPPFNIKIVKTI